MNRNQALALVVAAANIVFMMLFPPIDAFTLAKHDLPVFAGFYFYPQRNPYMVVNLGMLFLEGFVVMINACIAWLLLQTRKVEVSRRRFSLQNATLIVVAVNLVVIVMFPPFESVFAMSKAAIPSFEGFYFIFARQANHVIVTTVLYLEVFFVLINGAIFWLIFREKHDETLTHEEAVKLMLDVTKRGD